MPMSAAVWMGENKHMNNNIVTDIWTMAHLSFKSVAFIGLIRPITYSELKIIIIMMSKPEDLKKLWGTTLEQRYSIFFFFLDQFH